MINNNEFIDMNASIQESAEQQRRAVSVPSLLRTLGAFAVIASLSLFTLQGWSEGNDIKRYLTLMSQTGILVSSGFLLNWLIKERKGARLFFILALGSVLANVTILSALLYSFSPLDQNLIDYPDMMRWVVTSPTTFLPLAGISLVVLAALSYFAFSILARPIAKQLTLTLLTLCAVLLTPIREPMFAIGLAAIALLIASRKIKQLKDHPAVFKTFESRVAFAMLYIPSVIIVARAVLLYPIEPLVFAVFSLLSYAGLRYWRNNLGSHFIVESLSILSTFLAAFAISASFDFNNNYLAFSAGMISLLALSVDQMRECASDKTRGVIAGLLSFLVAPIVCLLVMLDNSLTIACIGLTANAAIVAINLWRNKGSANGQAPLVISALVFAATGLVGGMLIIEKIALGNWFLLGLLGVSMIFGSSLIEWYKNSFAKTAIE